MSPQRTNVSLSGACGIKGTVRRFGAVVEQLGTCCSARICSSWEGPETGGERGRAWPFGQGAGPEVTSGPRSVNGVQ